MIDDSQLRLFTAIELPEAWREALGHARAELEKLAPGEFRWVRPELMHLTLVFLGHQPPRSLPAVQAALSAARATVPPFPLSLGQAGCFGQPHNLHVLWVGLAEPPAELQGLHRSIAAHLSAAGVPFDAKPLAPHITVARGRRPVDRAASLRMHSALQRLRIPSRPILEVDEFVVMRSHLSRLGPEYQVVDRFKLGGAAT